MNHNLFNSLPALEKAGVAKVSRLPVSLRINTPIEVDNYTHGGILPYVLRELLA